MKENLLVPEQLINILDEPNVEGGADQDRNNGNDDEGVEMTNMVDEVFEDDED